MRLSSSRPDSGNTAVMTVSSTGIVQGVSVGSATITANFGSVVVYNGQFCVSDNMQDVCPTANEQAGTTGDVPPTISQSTDLWYFGGGVPTPSGFTLGSTNATLTANGASSGTFQWTSSDTTKLLLEGNTGTVTKTNVNTVGIISSGYSTSLHDVTVQLLFTPSGGSQLPAVNWTLSIDSPYKLATNGAMPPDRGVSTCTTPPSPSGTNGYESLVPYKIISFFNLQITHIGFYEILGQPSNNVTNNWGSPTPGGFITNDGTFVDQLCIAGSYNPQPLIPQSPLTSNLIQQIPQAWVVGTSDPNSGKGIEVQTDTQNHYIDHARHILVVSPVR